MVSWVMSNVFQFEMWQNIWQYRRTDRLLTTEKPRVAEEKNEVIHGSFYKPGRHSRNKVSPKPKSFLLLGPKNHRI